jgi:hypothetical protein
MTEIIDLSDFIGDRREQVSVIFLSFGKRFHFTDLSKKTLQFGFASDSSYLPRK